MLHICEDVIFIHYVLLTIFKPVQVVFETVFFYSPVKFMKIELDGVIYETAQNVELKIHCNSKAVQQNKCTFHVKNQRPKYKSKTPYFMEIYTVKRGY